MALTRRKKLAFALIAAALSAVGAVILLLAADLVLHARAERSAGLNRWGYRGPVVGRKQPGESRIVVVGGSTVFGYGVAWDESVPALLEQKLRARHPERPVSVINLGFNNEASHAFEPTLRDYDYLDYDVVVLYEGYNDMAGDAQPNRSVFRRDSAVFRLTGYMPILPLYLQEKAMSLRYGGDLSAAYAATRDESPTVFRPNLAERTSAAVLEGAAAVGESLSRQVGRLAEDDKARPVVTGTLGCRSPWVTYCENVYRSVTMCLEAGRGVLVVGQPAMRNEHAERHAEQQAQVSAMLQRHFGGNARVRYISLADAIDLRDPAIAYDTMHLTRPGNETIAERLVEPIVSLAGAK